MDFKSFFQQTKAGFVIKNLILAIILFFVFLALVILWLQKYTHHGVEVVVPDVTGLYLDVAEPALAQEQLKMIVIDSTFSKKVALGTIVEQNPPAGSHVKQGRNIYIIVNARTGKKNPLPDLRDVSQRQAIAMLQSMQVVISDTLYEPSEYKDLVLDIRRDGMSIEPGTMLEEGVRVSLVVGYGKGTELVSVPDVRGKTLQEARSILLSNYLTLGAVNYDELPDSENAGLYIVYSQTPGADTPLQEGSRVDISLSKNKEKIVSEHTTVSPDEDFF